MLKRSFIYLFGFVFVMGLVAVIAGFVWLNQSKARLDGDVVLNSLITPVNVTLDNHGIPKITAKNRLDAVRSLGYLSAQDRLFQMDLMRRKNAGRLAEVLGSALLDSDITARVYGFNGFAKTVFEQLPKHQQDILVAYSEGVNAFLQSKPALPFEFAVLGYQPEPWQATDCVLVALGMFDMLNAWAEQEERMLTVMDATLPPDVVAFLTPDTDGFTEQLVNYQVSNRPAQAIPVLGLQALFKSDAPLNMVQLHDVFVGSNAWAVNAKKTFDGRAILANDMHLDLSVPNIWYRYEMTVGDEHSAGVMLPGLPLLIAGSTKDLAWGNTNLSGDYLDLVRLELNPNNANEYKVGESWQAFGVREERIAIKDEPEKLVQVKQTQWGPVSPNLLLNQPVAIHWVTLDAHSINLDLMDLEQIKTVEQAVATVNRAGSPQLNMLFADSSGSIAWTLTGKIPKRFGNDGAISRSWANGKVGWQGYLSESELPKQINPKEGVLVSANDRRWGKEYPYTIGREFANGYRAYRIKQRLQELQQVNEWTMFALQQDTETEFYHFYQQLALSLLTPEQLAKQPELVEIRDYLLAWNGRADTDSLGLALLVEFRENLTRTVFSPFLNACKQADKNFHYAWTFIDTPLQALLTEKPASLLPDKHYADWNSFLLAQLQHSADRIKSKQDDKALAKLTWSVANKAEIKHPFSEVMPFLSSILDMPKQALAGCVGCVRTIAQGFGASERLSVSPAHLTDGILHLPAGQSAHPLSAYYRDQQRYWAQGLALPLLSGSQQHSLTFKPNAQ